MAFPAPEKRKSRLIALGKQGRYTGKGKPDCTKRRETHGRGRKKDFTAMLHDSKDMTKIITITDEKSIARLAATGCTLRRLWPIDRKSVV